MNQELEMELKAEQVKEKRINFSDSNRPLHLEAFFKWLPNDLHNAPLINWTLFPSRVIPLLINMDQKNIFARPLALIAGIISGTSGTQNENTLYHTINHIKLLLDKVQTVCDIQNIDELTKEVWETYISSEEFTSGDYKPLLMYKTCTE